MEEQNNGSSDDSAYSEDDSCTNDQCRAEINPEDSAESSKSLEGDSEFWDSESDEGEANVVSEKSKYTRILEGILKPKFEDITPLINSNIPFLVDGDSLMLSAFTQENYKRELGGQFLQVIYYCERVLDIFAQRGGKMIIVFFDIWEFIWGENWDRQSCRLAMYNHFKYNTKFRVIKFSEFYSGKFKAFLEVVKPRCVLLNLSTHIDVKELNNCLRKNKDGSVLMNETRAAKLFCGEILFFLNNDLPCVDVDAVHVDVSTISSYHLDNISYPKLARRLESEIRSDDLCMKTTKSITVKCNYEDNDARRVIAVVAASEVLKLTEKQSAVKLFLLTYAAQEVLKLENRGCPSLKVTPDFLLKLHENIQVWLQEVYNAIKCFDGFKLNWKTVGDLWQGSLFGTMCYVITAEISSGETLGLFQEAYENLVQQVQEESGVPLMPYPIEPFDAEADWCKLQVEELKTPEQVALQPVKNELVEKFCGNIFEEVKWTNPKVIFKADEFDELCHWHSGKPLTDESDHIFNTLQKKPSTTYELKRYQRQVSLHAKYMTIYGRSLEGDSSKCEAIICKEAKSKKGGSDSKKSVKVKGDSKKAKEIKDRNKIKKHKDECEKEKMILSNFKSYIDRHSDVTMLKRNLDRLNSLLIKFNKKESIMEGNVLKLKILSYICKLVFAGEFDKSKVDLSCVKEVFLTIRAILKAAADTKLSEKDEKLVSTLLHQFGFHEIAQMNKLKTVECETLMKFNWIRYQLQYVGPELEKGIEGTFDPDLGFSPDPWQTKFINAIRRNQSALVVAPTSSGKTFASYYCMKKVLQDSRDGIVVYVSPTKALVNQVAATVHHRFSNVKLDNGIATVGIFTRDYKTDALNSRILITVPQCLDIFLLSPRQHGWVKKVKYVIFDEVHRLLGDVEGLVWERCLLLIRCPFLALSATVSEPEYFHSWLQNMENFKREQDCLNNFERKEDSYRVNFVMYSERHSDLVKYTYESAELLHNHPYCALNSIALGIHEGIPPTVTLSPHETLQLFEAMSSEEHSERFLSPDLHPEVFFKSNSSAGFLERKAVREYEKKLGMVFYEMYVNHHESYESVMLKLQPKLEISSNNSEPGTPVIQNLLDVMEERNMLPAIVFSYNRSLIETLHGQVTEIAETSVVEIDRRVEKKNDQIQKKIKKEQEKDEAKSKLKDDNTSKRRVTRSLNILKETNSRFKGIGQVDAEDIKFIEGRLKDLHENDVIIKGFQHGFAYHHGGLNNRVRSSVEMLFRLGVIKVVFATGTLALGIHMPCKSVVVYGDSVFLNTLEYHQMSGRAGRRGFDIEGNVIFAELTKRRRDMLMTDKLPKIIGNYPISVTLLLRILLLVTKVTDRNCETEEATKISVTRALTLLENSLIFQLKPTLRDQIKYFVGFATQLLLMQDIIGNNGAPLKLGRLVTHLHYHEPANLALAYLLRSGILRKLTTASRRATDIQWSLVVVLSHLFTNLKLHKTQKGLTYNNSVVILEDLPNVVYKGLIQYNREVKFVFDEYFLSISKSLAKSFGIDDTLPLSKVKFQPLYECETETDVTGTISAEVKRLCVPRSVCSAFVALSGHGDKDLFTESLINNIRHEICPDINVIPLIRLRTDINAYAADFYRHGIKSAIVKDNRLKGGQEFTLLKDFMLMLKILVLSLEELEPVDSNDPLLWHIRAVSEKYRVLYSKAFGISFD